MTPSVVSAPLSAEQKASVTSGASFWATERVGGARAVFADGPHGVRAQEGNHDHLGINPSLPATCFPPAAGLGQCWDADLVASVAAALGREARHYGVSVLLGPGVNIRRDPRGGRNFEYYSEDPLLTGALGSAWVQGVQSTGVGASVKHFAANNAETDRMRSDSQVDPRALREIYLRGFERVVRSARPWTVMCAYNKLNGVLVSENRWLLTDVLRGEWGFDGVVVSDWGAVRSRAAAVTAGVDLTMPGGDAASDAALAAAAARGDVHQVVIDEAADRVHRLIERTVAHPEPGPVDFDAHHALAREAAARSIVLLQNRGALLPLPTDGSIAVIGRHAAAPRCQGGGSSRVRPTRVDIPLDEMAEVGGVSVGYVPGWSETGDGDADLASRAVDLARASDVAVVFLGLDEGDESEGYDREHIDLPAAQVELLRAVAAAQPKTVVVLGHGGVVLLEEIAAIAPAILDGGLLGQGGGRALADVLFGVANPSARLTESIPARLSDVPAYLNFPGEASRVLYGESVFVGYRWYDARDVAVTFPFGHGLSYTSFAYSELEIDPVGEEISVRVRVTNTGERAGREIVQLYVGKPDSQIRRAPRELKGFTSVLLEPGESAVVSMTVDRHDLAYWDERVDHWVVEPGDYLFCVGASSRDLRVEALVDVQGEPARLPLTMESTLGEVLADPVAGPVLAQALGGAGGAAAPTDEALGADTASLAASIPLDRLAGFSGGAVDPSRFQSLLDLAAAARRDG